MTIMNNLNSYAHNTNKKKIGCDKPMVRIGIISPLHKENIRRCLKSVLKQCSVLSRPTDIDTISALELSGVNFCILDLEKNSCFVDILILDTFDKELIAKALKSITPNTRLVYNSDICPEIHHPYAVGYGFSQNSVATVSSVDDASFLMCLHPLIRLDNTVADEREYLVSCSGSCISDALCAVACGALCGTVTDCSVSIF